MPQRPAQRQLHHGRPTGSGSSTGSTRAWATASSTSRTSRSTTSSPRTRATTLLDAYFGEVTDEAREHLRLMRFMSDFREAMWGVVQQGISKLDFDYADYANRALRAGARRERPGPGRRHRRRRRRLRRPLLADEARLGRRRARRARRPDERLDVPFRRPRRPAPRLAEPHEDDDELASTSTGRSATRSASRPAGTRSARCGSPRPRSAWRSSRARPAGRRRSACRSSWSPPQEAQRLFPPMSTDGVRGAAYLPTDGYIDPSQLTFALAEGARRGGAEIETNTRVTGIEVERGPSRGGRDRQGAASRPRSSSTPAGCSRPRSDALAGVIVPVIPMAHEYLVHAAGRPAARAADDARPLAARLLPRRVRRPRHGRLRAATRRRGVSTASRRTSTAGCSTRTGTASRS